VTIRLATAHQKKLIYVSQNMVKRVDVCNKTRDVVIPA